MAIRHHDLGKSLSDLDSLTTVGVVLTPRATGTRPWHTTMVRITGDLGHTPDELDGMRSLWPINEHVPEPPDVAAHDTDETSSQV